MSRFNDIGQEYAVPALQEQHGETIGYTITPPGIAAEIVAVVNRQLLETLGPGGEVRIDYVIDILVSQADVPAVTVNKDTVSVKKRLTDVGETTFTVSELLASDGGWWHLRVN